MKKIPVTGGHFAKVDNEDFEKVTAFKWYEDEKGYAVANGKDGSHLRMHRFILDCPKEMQVDHKNHDKRDNRKINLRICTGSQNQHNRKNYSSNKSGFKGVGWHRASNQWRARIQLDGVQFHLGLFKSKKKAHDIYKIFATKLHGEFACV